MKIKPGPVVIAFIASALGLFVALRVAAQSTPVRVIASNGVKGLLDDVQSQCEREIGHPLSIRFGTTAALKPQIEAGESFDVVILTSEAIDALTKEGKTTAGSQSRIGRIGIGIGIRKGAAKPDIATPEALKRTLLQAKSVTYAKEGASRPTVDKMLARFGIGEALKSKTLLLDGADQTSAAVADGRAEILITLISEIVSAPGVELAGPLPGDMQNYVDFSAAVGADTKNQDAGLALIRFLQSPKLSSVYKAKGMEGR